MAPGATAVGAPPDTDDRTGFLIGAIVLGCLLVAAAVIFRERRLRQDFEQKMLNQAMMVDQTFSMEMAEKPIPDKPILEKSPRNRPSTMAYHHDMDVLEKSNRYRAPTESALQMKARLQSQGIHGNEGRYVKAPDFNHHTDFDSASPSHDAGVNYDDL